MDPYNQQQNQHQQWYDPNQGAYQGQGYAPMTPQNYPPPVPQFQPQGDSDEDEEYDEERLTQVSSSTKFTRKLRPSYVSFYLVCRVCGLEVIVLAALRQILFRNLYSRSIFVIR